LRSPQALPQDPAHDYLAMYITLLQNQDDEGLSTQLLKTLAQEGLQKFVAQWMAPLVVMVGEAWARGDLAVHQEHLFTECVSRILRQAIAAIPKGVTGIKPTVLLTTFPQEAHGLGLLMVESELALQGCRCVSLGTQTPVRDIAQAAIACRADVVGLSFSVSMNPNHIVDGLAELKLLLPAHIEVWAGGQAPALRRRALDHVRVLKDLTSIEAAVNAWCKARSCVA
jgi:methanogenic corrinoid protein MtbC1